MQKYIVFVIFMIFNGIFGLSGLGVIGGGIFLIIKSSFNYYLIIIMGVGLFISLIFILGAFTWKRKILLIIYFILVLLMTLIEAVIALMTKFHDGTKSFLREHIKDVTNITITDEQKDKIFDVAVIALGAAASCGLLSFIFASIYYCILSKKKAKLEKDMKSGDDILKGLDYTNLSQVK